MQCLYSVINPANSVKGNPGIMNQDGEWKYLCQIFLIFVDLSCCLVDEFSYIVCYLWFIKRGKSGTFF